jgi:hypothetical protein
VAIKRSLLVPVLGAGGAMSILAAMGVASGSRSANCEETLFAGTQAACATAAGTAGAPECLRAFSEARARGISDDRIGAQVQNFRNGQVVVTAVVRDDKLGLGWRKLDGTVPGRTYRSCSRSAARSYSRSRSWFYASSGGSTTTSSRPSTTSISRPSTVGRGGFGSTASSFRASS